VDYTEYLRFALAFVFVLGLIGLFGWLAKRFGAIPKVGRGEGRRLGIVEVAAVDAKRRLVLVRRDRTEHLIMLGAAADLVIERGIPADGQDRGAEAAALSRLGGAGGS